MFPSHVIFTEKNYKQIAGPLLHRVMNRFFAWETTILNHERSVLRTARVGHEEMSKRVGVPPSEE